MIPDPIIFSWGPLTIRWYGVLIAGAIIIGTLLALGEVKKRGWNEDHFLNMILAMIPISIIGARLYYVIFKWSEYVDRPADILATWKGGLAIHGGLIAGILVICFFSWRYHFGFANTLDVVAPSVILGQAIGRWGNFFNQEAYGYAVDPETLPWAMYIDGAYRHPTFLYESMWNLLVFVFLLWLRRSKKILSGDLALAYLILYSVGRFVVEGFRTDSLMFGAFRTAQLISLATMLIAGIILWYRHKFKRDGGRIHNVR